MFVFCGSAPLNSVFRQNIMILFAKINVEYIPNLVSLGSVMLGRFHAWCHIFYFQYFMVIQHFLIDRQLFRADVKELLLAKRMHRKTSS